MMVVKFEGVRPELFIKPAVVSLIKEMKVQRPEKVFFRRYPGILMLHKGFQGTRENQRP
jgi:hypothetical protein